MDIDGPARSPGQLAAGKRKRLHDDLVHTPIPTDDIDLVNSDGIPLEFASTEGHTIKRPRRHSSLDPSQLNCSQANSLHVTDLPPETLQHIFSYVHPITLGRLLSVCKLFSALLNPTEVLPAPSPGIENVSLRKQNDIWTLSRKIHLPGYPRPMESMTELDMWKLLRVRRCQFCHRKAKRSPSFLNTSPWNGGPGPDDVRTIWPFRVRSCGDCLRPRLRLDKELLLSASSFLSDGLPFAFFTPSHHYVTAINLDQNQPPLNLQLKKYFYQPHIDELEDKVIEVRALGNGVVEEWSKGLEANGRARREDAARFERWELTFAAHLHIESGPASFVEPARPFGSLLPSNPSLVSDTSATQSREISMTSPARPPSAQSSRYSGRTAATSLPVGPEMPLQPFAPAPGQVSPYPYGASFPKTESVASERTARSRSKPRPTPQDVERLRSEKRADIGRRCQQIDPPIRPSILPFMDAYNAAIQIPMPLNDFSWDFLKRQLIAQRDEADQKEREHLAAMEASQLAEEDRRLFEEQRRLDKATNDRIWAELGTPPRQKLKAYAEEYVATIWDSGLAVTQALSSKFAADLLVHVVRRFTEGIVQEDDLLASRNMRLPAGSGIPDMRRLKLEDLKWVYEESVRPHTDRFGKEIFLCNVCENTAKRFTFDAVVQHYAAKHTNDLSKGNQVVYWKAEWPNPPPFHTFPEAVWNRPPDSRSPMYATNARSPHHVPGFRARADSPGHSPGRTATWIPDEPIRPPTLYDQHCEEVVDAAASAFEITENIKGLPDSVRLYVIVRLVVRSFRRKFPNDLTLALFADCVNTKSSLRHIRDLHGLRCRACQMDPHALQHRQQGEFWFADLLDHFQKSHIQHNMAFDAPYGDPAGPVARVSRQRLDWQLDMVDLPHEQIIRNLAQAPGMDANKLEVMRSVFPRVFHYGAHALERPDDVSLRPYYFPHVGQHQDEYGVHLPPRPSDRMVYSAAAAPHLRYEVVSGPPFAGQDAPNIGADIPANPTEWRHQPAGREVLYRPQREIVYFDDHREPVRRPVHPETVRHAEQASVSWQPMPMREQGGAGYYRPQQLARSHREHEGPHNLPFRLHHVDAHIIDRDTEANLARSPNTSTIPPTTPAVAEEELRRGDDPMTDAENFLNTFDPLADQEEAGTASMSRTVSMHHRSLNDDEVGSTVSSRLSQSGTPGLLRRDGLRGRGSQTASRIDTPNESHASRYMTRDASPDSRTVKSELGLAHRRNDKASSVRPRTPPASQSPYHDSNNGPSENMFPAYHYDMSPASTRHEILESRHSEGAPFHTAGFHHSHARQRYSPVGVQYYEREPSVRYVEVVSRDGRHSLGGPVSPQITRYEYERLPPRGLRYIDEGTRHPGFRESVAAPEDYRHDAARPGLGETHMYYVTPSSEPANRAEHRRMSSTAGPGGYATRQPWSGEAGGGH